MKTRLFRRLLCAGTGLALMVGGALAQPADTGSGVPLSYGASQILKLSQAKVGDDTVVSYVKNSGNSYRLNADQIIYLRQQGVSDVVIQTMLSQPQVGLATTSAGQSATVTPPVTTEYNTVSEPPAVTYVPSAPATYYYDQPVYYPAYYGWSYPFVSIGWGGWRGYGWRGYGGFHSWGNYGGWHGNGWHGGTTWHGGSVHGWSGGHFSGHGGMSFGGHFGGHR